MSNLRFQQTKQALKFELDQLIDQLEIEEKNERDTMNWSGEGNDRMVWRFTNKEEIKEKMIVKINQVL